MSETKWTPGPWHVADDHHVRAVLDVRDSDGWDVAKLYSARGDVDTRDSSGVWRDDPVRIANARLIAAAPELYEALVRLEAELVEDKYGENYEPSPFENLAIARAALAKARGES